jgi:hypothetical protein
MDQKSIPYFAHEGMMARMERTIKRLWIALIIVAAMMFASNAAWLYAWMQYDYVDMDRSIDINADNGTANYIGNDGDITNGTNPSKNQNQDGEEAKW